jgi:hypothetical protein
MGTLIPALIGATVGMVGVVLFILFGRAEKGGVQTPTEHALRARVAAWIAFVYLGVIGIACALVAILASTEAATAMGLALAIAIILAVGTQRERERAIGAAGDDR